MSRYIIRLDDASEYMDAEKWQAIETLLDEFSIRPIVGVIPDNHDPDMCSKYVRDPDFWQKVHRWKDKGWTIALHGYSHVFESNDGGINPVNNRSEFAGVSVERQKEKIQCGVDIFRKNRIEPDVFFAPAHTFDENTLIALKEESKIRIISDTIANDVYYKDGFYYIPQQSGKVRELPFKVCTFCYHPNAMNDSEFGVLRNFICKNQRKFVGYTDQLLKKRETGTLDFLLRKLYFLRRK